jgi:predicted TIM-barrel fold metal-dependent hydrolase
VDTHAHIFKRGLPLAGVRRYTPDYDATLEMYLSQLDQHGLDHGVLVQPSFLGTDNSFMLDALASAPGRLRGIAVLDPLSATPAQLARLDAAGVVGVRLNLIGHDLPDLASAAWQPFLAMVARLDWQVEIHRAASDLPKILPPLIESGVNVVVDHFGRPDPSLGVQDPGFLALLAAGASRKVWVKLSAAYRNGANGVGERIALEAVPLLKQYLGLDRLVWGSDWPHTQYEKQVGYSATRALLDQWLPDPAERHQVLSVTPASLFHFN